MAGPGSITGGVNGERPVSPLSSVGMDGGGAIGRPVSSVSHVSSVYLDCENLGGRSASLARIAEVAAIGMRRHAMGAGYSPVNNGRGEGELGDDPDVHHFTHPSFLGGGGFEGDTKDVGNEKPRSINDDAHHERYFPVDNSSSSGSRGAIIIGMKQNVPSQLSPPAQRRSSSRSNLEPTRLDPSSLPTDSPLTDLVKQVTIQREQLNRGNNEQTNLPRVSRSHVSSFAVNIAPRDGIATKGSDVRPDRLAHANTFNVQKAITEAKSFGNDKVVPALAKILKAVDAFCSKVTTPGTIKLGQLYAKGTSKMFKGAEKFAANHPDTAFVLGAGLIAGSIALAAETAGIGLVVFPVTMPLAAGLIHGAAKEKSNYKANNGKKVDGQYELKGAYAHFSDNIKNKVSSKVGEYLKEKPVKEKPEKEKPVKDDTARSENETSSIWDLSEIDADRSRPQSQITTDDQRRVPAERNGSMFAFVRPEDIGQERI